MSDASKTTHDENISKLGVGKGDIMIEINKKQLCESCFREIDNDICPYCGFSAAEYSADPLALPVGTRLNDKMIIGGVMGKGGFGITYLGYDLRMDKIIAVKEYYPNGIAYRSPSGTEVLIADEKYAEAFENGAQKFYTEAEMVAQFNGNPNIVSVYDYFRANNTVYLIMEYLRGLTLKNYVKKHGKLTDGQALFIIDKIAAALSITHSAGILHRDISPDNIMLCMDGKVKLIDFGAARQIMAESSSNLTVVMKPGYTPIEQYTKKGRQGAWTDIYSLGVSIYYALTGVIIDDPYARIDEDGEFSENKHGINNDLWAILKKCTMINASERYGSAIDLRKALRSVSVPIKSEPVILSEDDLKSDNDSNASEEFAADTSEQEYPTAVPVGKTDEEIEVFEDKEEEPPAVVNNAAESAVKNSSDKKKDKKKFVTAGICAAVVIAIAAVIWIVIGSRRPNKISTSVTEPVTIQEESISKSLLENYDGDIRVTLKTQYKDEYRDPDGNYYHCIKMLADNEKEIDVNAISLARDEYKFFNVNGDGMDFVFVIPREVSEQVKHKVYFELNNIIVNSVTLEEDRYDKVIEFDDVYPGDWELDGFIPKSELKSFNSDVRICYDVDVKLLGSADDPYYHIMPKTAFYDPISVTANNQVLYNDDELYEFFQEGESRIVFEISRKEIESLLDEGIAVQVHNVLVKSASLQGIPEGSVTVVTPAKSEPESSAPAVSEPESSAPEGIEKPLYIPLGTERPGEWNIDRKHVIGKDILNKFNGDIKIELDIETVELFKNDEGYYYHCLQIVDVHEAAIPIDVPNRGCDYWDNYGINDDQTKFTFIVRKDEIPNIYIDIEFAAENLIVHGATLSDYDPDEYKPSPDAKVIELSSEVDKMDEWYFVHAPYSPVIPKEELESFDSDVRVTLTMEMIKQYTAGDNYEEHDVCIYPRSDHSVIIKADNTFTDDGGTYALGVVNVPDTFTFVISKNRIAKLSDEGLYLDCRNLRITSAALEKAEDFRDLPEHNSSSDTSAVIEKPLYIPLGTDNPGEWKFDDPHTISKDVLEQFTGDIKIVLDIETVEIYTNDGGYGHCVQIADGGEEAIDIDAPNIGCDVRNGYGINDGAAKFTFILPKDEVPRIYKEIKFAAENTVIHGAALYDYDPDEYKVSAEAKVITLTSDVDKVDDRYVVCPPNCPNIPKKELESFGGDVKVTLSMKQLKEPNKYEENLEPYDCFIQPWCDDHFVIIKADNAFVTEDGGNCLLNVKNVPNTFTFVISKSEIAKLDDEYGLDLICRNLLISSAALEKAQ